MAAGLPDFLQSYEVVGKLREGGMGAIYRVRHRLLDQHRVIKIVRPQLGADSDFHARFLREAKLVAQLRHPNIALLYEFSLSESGAGSIVMEFIDGVSLKDALENHGRLSIGLALEVVRQALSALDYLHGGGVLHRDISPDNLMLTRDRDGAPLVKLIDLGIAKRVGESNTAQLTGTGTFLGKVRYASPEQFGRDEGEELDARTDLYSLGIVLYELLTGSFPIRGDDANSMIAGHLFHPPRPFDEVDAEGLIPEELRAMVLRALHKDRNQRFGSAAEFQAALEPLERRYLCDRQEVASILAAAAAAAPAPGPAGFEDLSLALGGAASPDAGTLSAPTLRRRVDTPTALSTKDSGESAPGSIDAPTVLFVATPSPVQVAEALPRRRRWPWLVASLAVLVGLALALLWLQRTRWNSGDAVVVQELAAGRGYALVIGNDRYQRMPHLRSATADAQAIGDLLAQRYAFTVERLTDANRDQIVTALDFYQRKLRPTDRLLVFYAGHGGVERDADGNRIGYWLPVDAGPSFDPQWIPNQEISDYLEGMAARHVLVLADSCYAGTLSSDELVSPPTANTAQERTRLREQQVRSAARLALTSGGLFPVPEPGQGHRSLFASALLGILTGNRGVLSSTELFERLRGPLMDAARRQGQPQTPTFGVIAGVGDERGEFFFAPAELLSRLQAPGR